MRRLFCYTLSARAIGATVSAGALHAQGWGFESLIAHHLIDKAVSNDSLSFLGPSQRDSNPQGCGAEETRSVFQRSTQEAKRRSGTRPPTRRTRNPSVPAIKIERPEPITAQGAFLWASGGIRTRKGAKPRKREAFSSAARKERSDAAGRGRRKGGRGIPPSHSRHLGTFLKCRH